MTVRAAGRRSAGGAALLAVVLLPGALTQAADNQPPAPPAGRTGGTLDKPPHPLLAPLVPQLQFGFYRQPVDVAESAAPPPPSADPRDLAGRYTPLEATLLLPGERGRMASYTDRGARTFLARAQQVVAGPVPSDPLAQCKPESPVRALNDGFPIQVLQSPTQLVMIHMANHLVRRIRIGGGTAAAEAAPPSFAGTSTGRWAGNTLVVETRGIRDGSWLDEYGSPGGERLMLTERYTKQPNGSLRLEATINDPANYLEPIRIVRNWGWSPGVDWHERICEEHGGDDRAQRP